MAFQLTELKKKNQETGNVRTLVTFNKAKLLFTRRWWEKIPPDRDWWVGSVLKNCSQWGAKWKWPVLHFSVLYQGTWAWDTELREITISIFPRQVSLCKVRLVCTLSLNWNQRDLALHMERQKVKTKVSFSRTEEKKSLETRVLTDST